MQLGSPEHKAQFLQDLRKTYQENIWKDEINLLEFEELLGRQRTELAEIELKLERKEFKSAGEGRNLYRRNESEIEAIKAAIAGTQDKLKRWQHQIELIKRYQESA